MGYLETILFDPFYRAPYAFFTFIVFLLGASLGSFLNVCVYRIPREKSVVRPRSSCPNCNSLIVWHDNIPLLSYVLLMGKCRNCKTRISPRYFTVELLTGILFLLVWLKFGPAHGWRPLGLVPLTDWTLVPIYWLVVFGLLLGTFVDLDFMILPDRVTIGGVVIGIPLSLAEPAMHAASGRLAGLWSSLFGAALGFSILWSIALVGRLVFKKDAMGFGDVKLMAAIGAFFGWQSVLVTLVLSSLLGSIVGMGLVIAGKKELQGRIPYGPFIAAAALVWMLWGPALVTWYMRLVMPSLYRGL